MSSDRKTIIVNDDGHGGFFLGNYDTVEGLQAPIEGYRGTTLTIFEWGVCLGTKVNFLSEHFERFGVGGKTDFSDARRGDRHVAQVLADYTDQGIDPLNVMADKVHDVGMQFHASIRMNPDYNPTWMGEWMPNNYNDSFYHEHPHLRIQKKDGSPDWHISYAYEEMQQRKLLLVEELCAYPIDGINLDFLRHPPFVGYDPPLVERFQQRHGEDPRLLPEDDPRWLTVLSEPMTEYLRGVRRIAGERTITARFDQRFIGQQGLDIGMWLREGLVDIIIPGEERLGGYIFDLRPWVALAAGRALVLYGEEAVLSGHDLTAEEDRALAKSKRVDVSRRKLSQVEYCQRALHWYAQGADGIHIFNDQHNYEALAVLGDPDRCQQVAEEEAA